ncbi:MAG: carbohydrate binding domain-containing protein, partial [Firmicutes bacterium]|nr:carbohydrate binding domain-containing protein [Bacillota bacterium]
FVGKGNTGATQIYTTISEAKVWGLTVNYLQNPGLETGSVSPWTDDGNAGPTISTDAHSGQYALYTARAHDYNGPTQNVTNIFNKYGEGTYYAEAWVKLPSGQANDTLCFTVDSTTANGIRSYDDFANKAISASNGWVQFSGEKEVLKKGGQAGTYSIVNFKLDGNGTSSVLTDDFALNRVPPSFTSVTSSGGTTFEVGAVSGNLTINGSSFSPGIAKVYLVPQSGTDILLTGGKAADTTRQIVIPLNTSLPVGVYKIKVAVSDISTVYSSMTITVTPKVNLLANPGLETGSVSPWTDDGNAGPTISSDAHSGQYALYTARAHDYNGPTQNVTDIFNKYGEGTYYAEAWAKLPAGQANDTLCFTVDSTTTNGIRSYDDFAGKAISSSNGWVQLSGQKEVLKKSGQTGAYSLVNFKLDGNGASAVLADDFVLRRVAPSFTTVTSSGGTSFKQGSVSGTLTINGSSFSPGIAKVYLVPQSGAEIQLTGTKTVDTTSQIIIPLNVNLPAGVYMVKVAVADVSSIYQSLTITVS